MLYAHPSAFFNNLAPAPSNCSLGNSNIFSHCIAQLQENDTIFLYEGSHAILSTIQLPKNSTIVGEVAGSHRLPIFYRFANFSSQLQTLKL